MFDLEVGHRRVTNSGYSNGGWFYEEMSISDECSLAKLFLDINRFRRCHSM